MSLYSLYNSWRLNKKLFWYTFLLTTDVAVDYVSLSQSGYSALSFLINKVFPLVQNCCIYRTLETVAWENTWTQCKYSVQPIWHQQSYHCKNPISSFLIENSSLVSTWFYTVHWDHVIVYNDIINDSKTGLWCLLY